MSTNATTTITIAKAQAALTKYTHAAPEYYADELKKGIKTLERLGLTVTAARSAKCAVPNSYRNTRGMIAPCWFFNAESRVIEMGESDLERRTRGANVPARYYLAGSVETPAGFRCIKRDENETIIVHA